MKTIFDDHKIELKCECGRKFTETIGRLNKNPSIKCSCGIVNNIKADELSKTVKSLQGEIDKLAKNITIKF